MKLGYTIIYVADVPRSITFYEAAFGLQRKFIHESNCMASWIQGKQRWHSLGLKPQK